MKRLVLLIVALVVVGIAMYLALRTHSGQVADPDFDASVIHPTYTSTHPVVCFDEGHRNFHTARGGYRPFAKLMRNDGYDIRPTNGEFTAQFLESCRVLIIANAKGANDANDHSAFKSQEISTVRQWVTQGGSLLLITDHFPFGSAVQSLFESFVLSTVVIR